MNFQINDTFNIVDVIAFTEIINEIAQNDDGYTA
jgi:hypothetical protein